METSDDDFAKALRKLDRAIWVAGIAAAGMFLVLVAIVTTLLIGRPT